MTSPEHTLVGIHLAFALGCHRRWGWTAIAMIVLVAIAILCQLVHLPCDMVVSGGNGLSDWPIEPFWPVSKVGYVLPLIPWGDVGPTVIMMIGVILIAKKSDFASRISIVTLAILLGYLLARGVARGVI